MKNKTKENPLDKAPAWGVFLSGTAVGFVMDSWTKRNISLLAGTSIILLASAKKRTTLVWSYSFGHVAGILLQMLSLRLGNGKDGGGGNGELKIPIIPKIQTGPTPKWVKPSNAMQFIITDDQIYVRQQPVDRLNLGNFKEDHIEVTEVKSIWAGPSITGYTIHPETAKNRINELMEKAIQEKLLIEIIIFEANVTKSMKNYFKMKETEHKNKGGSPFVWQNR